MIKKTIFEIHISVVSTLLLVKYYYYQVLRYIQVYNTLQGIGM